MNLHPARSACSLLPLLLLATPLPAAADGTAPDDAKPLVEAPKAVAAPTKVGTIDGSTLTLSLGGQLAAGNTRQQAITANGAFETRFLDNGIGAYLLGNFGRAAPPKEPFETTAENIQGRVRYDRYLLEALSVFVLNTGRHDRFQGLRFRYNLDPGVRYLFLTAANNTLWAEAGYDFQYDMLLDSARPQLSAAGAPVVNGNGTPVLLPPTKMDHSARLYLGYRHGFNKEVSLTVGVEYLQSFVDGHRARLNGDGVVAAKIGYGLAFGLGVSLRYDHAPLPGKQPLDFAGTLSLIYAISDTQQTP